MEYQLGLAPRPASKPAFYYHTQINTRRVESVPTLTAFGDGWFFQGRGSVLCIVSRMFKVNLDPLD